MTDTHPDLATLEPGWVWLAGAGPGDPGLLTRLAWQALHQADVIVHDALVNSAILDLAPARIERIDAGKRGGRPSALQADICQTLIGKARSGKRVLRLKGGDPMVFGRGGEEALALAEAGIPFRLVPGISAAIGGLAYAGIPLTQRGMNSAVTFVTGHDRKGGISRDIDWERLAVGSPVLVICMALANIDALVARLLFAGRRKSEPVALISRASLPDQTVIRAPLGDIVGVVAARQPATPSLMVLGPVVGLHDLIGWFVPPAPKDSEG